MKKLEKEIENKEILFDDSVNSIGFMTVSFTFQWIVGMFIYRRNSIMKSVLSQI